MKNYPKVTFGMVNCNRLFYLKSCLQSLIECTKDYPNKEIIVIDNASQESGTKEYLDSIEYVKFFTENSELTGSIGGDAQRGCRLTTGTYLFPKKQTEFKFVYNRSYNPISGAGEVMYSRKMLDKMYPWSTNNDNHEGGGDSESKMLNKINKILGDKKSTTYLAMPIFPIAAGIYTDSRGTNARVRKNKRYGNYWEAKDSFKYYKIHDYEKALKFSSERDLPLGIEFVANPIGWKQPLDKGGNWLKNPIRPENCSEDDYKIID